MRPTTAPGVDRGNDLWQRICDNLSQLPLESKQRVLRSISQLPPDSWKIAFDSISHTIRDRRSPSPVPPDSLQRVLDITIENIKKTKRSGLEEMKGIAPMSQSLESKSQSTHPYSLPSNSSGNNNRLPGPGASKNIQPIPMPMPTNQSQPRQHNKNIQNNLASLTSLHPTVSGLAPMGNSIIQGVNTFPTQGKQSKEQLSQMQPQPTQLQQQLGLHRQPNELQGDMQLGIEAQAPGSMLLIQNVIDQQKQLHQSQKPHPKMSFASLDSTPVTGQEEVHQKLGQSHFRQPQTQVSEVQSHENKMNPQIQSMNMQICSGENMATMQHTSLPSLSGLSTSQQMNSLQKASNLDSGQGDAVGPLQQTTVEILQQNTARSPQQANVTNFSLISEAYLQNLPSNLNKAGTPFEPARDSEKPATRLLSLSNSGNMEQKQATGTRSPSRISAVPSVADFTVSDSGGHFNAVDNIVSGKSNVSEQPIERLIRAVKYITPQALSAAVSDIFSVVNTMDRIAGSVPGNGSGAETGEDLVAMTNFDLQEWNSITQEGITGTRKMKRSITAMPLNVVSSPGSVTDSIKFSGQDTPDLESTSTSTSNAKKPRIEVCHTLLEEIRAINNKLVDTEVEVSGENVRDENFDPTASAEESLGTIVKCSYLAVALSPAYKAHYASGNMSQIQPLRLLVPANYPMCSPIVLDNLPDQARKDDEDVSVKAKSRFGIAFRKLLQPISVTEIAMAWNNCVREVIIEYAAQRGGGTFSSIYGTWNNC